VGIGENKPAGWREARRNEENEEINSVQSRLCGGETGAKPAWWFERKLSDLFGYGLRGGWVVMGRGKGWQKTKEEASLP